MSNLGMAYRDRLQTESCRIAYHHCLDRSKQGLLHEFFLLGMRFERLHGFLKERCDRNRAGPCRIEPINDLGHSGNPVSIERDVVRGTPDAGVIGILREVAGDMKRADPFRRDHVIDFFSAFFMDQKR